jgi:formylglycine-generating enzyme required for sulfatase activity/tRNA A-37 threonylcarbamoyl transferase component Bud32
VSSRQGHRSANDPDDDHGDGPSVDPSSHVERRSPPDVVVNLRAPPSIVTAAGEARERGRLSGRIEPGDVIDGTYRVIRAIGAGGMGAVFEVEHCLIKRRGALKVLHPELARDQELVTRFIHEAQAAAAIGSEHIVEVTDAGIADDGVPYLVMELLDGRDLRQELKARGRLAPGRATALAFQVCRGLAAAHAKGIVHRDLKPENLLLYARADGGEGVKILDFGMAKFHDLRITGSAATLGSPYFMAPEQFGGSRDVDHRCDLYALGVILYELLTGELPFKGPSLGELVYQVVMTTPRPPRQLCAEIPAPLEAVVLKAMAADPDDRYESATELGEALASFRASAPDSSAPAHAGPRMVLVPAGWFFMGSPKDDARRFADEGAHEVVISRAFWLGAAPVTQGEWQALMGSSPSHFMGLNRPVEMVSWFDAIAYCNALSAARGLEPAYVLTDVIGQPASPGFSAKVAWRGVGHPGYRLPTESEWEYACRGGTADADASIQEIAWCRDTSGGETHPVGRKKPNAFGLHDMLGNVWEWCWDWYGTYPTGTVVDPVGPPTGRGRVDRGGGWDSEPLFCRPADRDGFIPGSRNRNLGFRVARTSTDDDA